MKYYVSKAAVCPFYTNEDRRELHCKGIRRALSLHLVFSDKKQMSDFKGRYCCHIHGYVNCPIYVASVKDYEKEDETPCKQS